MSQKNIAGKIIVSFPDESIHYFNRIQENVPYKSNREGYIVSNAENNRNGYLKFATHVIRDRFGRIKFKGQTATHYGELIAKKIAEKVGIAACDAEVGFKEERQVHSSKMIPIAISYFDLQPTEELITAKTIIDWFKLNYEQEARENILKGNVSDYDWEKGIVNCNIPLLLTAFDRYLFEMTTLSEEDRQNVKQSIIDMIMYDCKFGNTDRHDENFGLGVFNDGTGRVRFYPLFDNETILGFSTSENDIRKCNGKYNRIIPNKLWSLLNFGYSFSEPHSADKVIRDLFEACPKETMYSYNKVKKITTEELEVILDGYEELGKKNPLRREYTITVFNYLDKQLSMIFEKAACDLNKDNIEPKDDVGGSLR